MPEIRGGSAVCALCREPLRPNDDAVVTPDFLADDADPFYPYSDAAMHRACFIVWDQRKAFIAHFNRIAERFTAQGGSRVHMTSEGDLVERHDGPPPPGPAPH